VLCTSYTNTGNKGWSVFCTERWSIFSSSNTWCFILFKDEFATTSFMIMLILSSTLTFTLGRSLRGPFAFLNFSWLFVSIWVSLNWEAIYSLLDSCLFSRYFLMISCTLSNLTFSLSFWSLRCSIWGCKFCWEPLLSGEFWAETYCELDTSLGLVCRTRPTPFRLRFVFLPCMLTKYCWKPSWIESISVLITWFPSSLGS
jgi:hypothetical protein